MIRDAQTRDVFLAGITPYICIYEIHGYTLCAVSYMFIHTSMVPICRTERSPRRPFNEYFIEQLVWIFFSYSYLFIVIFFLRASLCVSIAQEKKRQKNSENSSFLGPTNHTFNRCGAVHIYELLYYYMSQRNGLCCIFISKLFFNKKVLSYAYAIGTDCVVFSVRKSARPYIDGMGAWVRSLDAILLLQVTTEHSGKNVNGQRNI